MSTLPLPAEPGTLLSSLRRELHDVVLTKRRRSLFELCDAVPTSAARERNPAQLSLSTTVGHGALYQALRDGELDASAMTQLAVRVGDALGMGRLYAVDESNVPAPRAGTREERHLLHTSGGHRRGHHAVLGHSYQAVTRLTTDADSWSLPVSLVRVSPHEDLLEVTIEQIRLVTAASGATHGEPDLFLLDSGYPAPALTRRIRHEELPAVVLVRLSTTQAFNGPPGSYRGVGRPRVHGERLHPFWDEPEVPPHGELSLPDPVFGHVRVRCWHAQHQDNAALGHPEGSVYRVDVAHLRRGMRRSVMGLWCSRPVGNLAGVLHTYLRRFDVEHLFRLGKHVMGWLEFHPKDHEVLTRWLRLQLLSLVQLFVVRYLATHERLPWERETRRLSPVQVLRVVSRFLVTSWHPAPDARTHVPGSGRPVGSTKPRRKRHPPVRGRAKKGSGARRRR